MRLRGSVVLAVLAAGLAACSGGGGGDSEAGVPRLTLDGVTYGPPDVLLLSVAPAPTGNWGWYELEGRFSGGTWELISPSIPIETTQLTLTADNGLPEGQTLEFRIRGWVGTERSPWSSVVSISLPVRPAEELVATVFEGSPPSATVYWRNQSRWADRVLFERRGVAPGGLVSPWEPIDIGLNATYWTGDEAGFVHGHAVEYRVTYFVGNVASQPVSTRTKWSRPGPVSNLQATVVGRTVHLSWVGPSDVFACTYEVMRQSATAASPVGEPLPGPAAGVTVLDLPDEPYGRWRYAVRARITEADDPSGWQYAQALVAREGMQVTVFSAPPAERAARDAAGHLALERRGSSTPGGCTPWGAARVWFPKEPARGELVRPDGWLLSPGVIFGAGGVAHAIHERDCALTHLWNDGAWHEEPISVAGCPASYDFSVDASGALHVLLKGAGGFQHVSNAGGTWALVEVVAPPVENALGMGALAFTPAGDPGFIAMKAVGLTLHLVRRIGGTWTSEQLPFDNMSGGSLWTPEKLVLPADGRVLLLLSRGQWRYLAERDSAGWHDPVPVIGNSPWGGGYPAASMDGARLVVPQSGDELLSLAVRDGETWSLVPLLNGTGAMESGLDGAGKWWVLDGLGSTCNLYDEDPRTYVLYTEP